VLAAFLDYCCEPDGSPEQQDTAGAASSNSSNSSNRSSSRSRNRSRNKSSMSEDDQDDSNGEIQLGTELSMAGKRAVRKAIGFAVDIDHAEALNKLFLQAGVQRCMTGLCLVAIHAGVSPDAWNLPAY
jgi:hypothetical protein